MVFGVLTLGASPARLHHEAAGSELLERSLPGPPTSMLTGPVQARGIPAWCCSRAPEDGSIEPERGYSPLSARSLSPSATSAALGSRPVSAKCPLETITAALDALLDLGCSPIGLVGTSQGAEAALLVAHRHPIVRAVVTLAPRSAVWVNVGPGRDCSERRLRSSWT